jgi:Papain-like cysteine protease AvrRpt2
MAQILTANARNVKPKGQGSEKTCWLTAYEMLFNSGGEFSTTWMDIQKRLKDGGFDSTISTGAGLLDDDFIKMSRILNTGTLYPGQLYTIGGVSRNLLNYGVLWLALQIPKNKFKIDGERFKHIIVVVGVDEENESVGIINPWMQNGADYPTVTWPEFSWLHNSIRYTEGLEAGCQYYRRGDARSSDER